MTRARELADLLTGGQTITTDDNTTQLTLTSTDADANIGPTLDLVRDSSSPADNDLTGSLVFKADDAAGNATKFVEILTQSQTVADGSEDGRIQMSVMKGGTARNVLDFTNTGVVFNEDSVDTDFRIESNGDANMFFVDAGNNRIGVGTNSPTVPFEVKEENAGFQTILDNDNGSAKGLKVRIKANDSGDFPVFQAVSGSTGSDVEVFTILDDGKVGIGTTSPTLDSALAGLSVSSNSTLLQIHDSDGACIKLSDPASGANRGLGIALQGTSAVISNCESGELRFGTGNTERARFDSSGRFMVGANDANSAQFTSSTSATGEFAADLRSTSSSYTSIVCLLGSNTNTTNSTYDHLRCDIHGVAQKLAIRDSGNVVNSNNSYGSLSDSRMKENIVDAASQWDDIKALQVRKYNRIGETQKELGVIAQELEASGMDGLVEEARYYDVNNNPDEETRKSVKYSVLYMKAVKALQEAMTRIETLETQNTTQATQIADLITRVTALEAE